MKIAYVVINANRREGTSRAIVEVAERLATRHHVTLIARTVESVDLSNIRCQTIHAPAWPDVAEFEVSRWLMNRALAKNKFDIVHSAGCNTIFADVYAIQTVHPVKMQVNSNIDRNRDASRLRQITRWLYDCRVVAAERKCYRSINSRGNVGFLPVSQGTSVELLKTYKLAGTPLAIIPNGADLSKFNRDKNVAARLRLRAEFDCPDNTAVFLFAGGEWKRKGLKLALEGLARIKDSSSVLWVAGSDPDLAAYRQLAAELLIADKVRWLGFRSDMECLYAAADVFLFPSFYEAFSLATIEAAASRLPIIMCDISGAQELLGDGKAGFIVDRDSDALAIAMSKLTNSRELREKMGAQGRLKVEQVFSWDHIAARTEAFYEHLLAVRKNELAAHKGR